MDLRCISFLISAQDSPSLGTFSLVLVAGNALGFQDLEAREFAASPFTLEVECLQGFRGHLLNPHRLHNLAIQGCPVLAYYSEDSLLLVSLMVF